MTLHIRKMNTPNFMFVDASVIEFREFKWKRRRRILIGRAGASPRRTTGPRCLYIYMYLCMYLSSPAFFYPTHPFGT